MLLTFIATYITGRKKKKKRPFQVLEEKADVYTNFEADAGKDEKCLLLDTKLNRNHAS